VSVVLTPSVVYRLYSLFRPGPATISGETQVISLLDRPALVFRVKTADLTNPHPPKSDVVPLTHHSSPSQILVRIVRHEIRDGPPTTLGYSFGMRFCLYSWATLILCSVNCASIHRKIGTHITKVYVSATSDVYRLTLTRNLQEKPDNGCLDEGTS
jgi:hypothetical protein